MPAYTVRTGSFLGEKVYSIRADTVDIDSLFARFYNKNSLDLVIPIKDIVSIVNSEK